MKIKKIAFIVIFVSLLGFLLFNAATCSQTEKIILLEKQIDMLKTEQSPIRFKITERKDGKITVVVKFYDIEEKKIKSFKETMEGDELSFDFFVFKSENKSKHISFPYKIYTDKIAPDNGKIITSYYNKNGFPQIFHSKNMDKNLNKTLVSIFEKMNSQNISSEDDYFGNMVHDISGMKSYKVGSVYKIITHTKGGIEVIEE